MSDKPRLDALCEEARRLGKILRWCPNAAKFEFDETPAADDKPTQSLDEEKK